MSFQDILSSQALGFVQIPLNLVIGGMNATSTIRYDDFVRKLFKEDTYEQMVNHAALGVCGEAGELADALKKHVHYRKPLDRKNVVEELGDLRFYIQAVQNLFGITEQEILQHNADKLGERYAGLVYSDSSAIARADKKEGEA